MLTRTHGKGALPSSEIFRFSNIPNVNTDAVIILEKVEHHRWAIHGIQFSYSDAPIGRLQIDDGNFDLDITQSGLNSIYPAWVCTLDSTVTITLKAGGTRVQGKLNVQAESMT
jgi:hypothetical protein